MHHLLTDFVPLIIFFIVFHLYNIYWATGVAIIVAVLLVLWLLLTHRKVRLTNWFNLFVIVVFGGLTIWLHDDTFIKLKPSILYGCFALALFGLHYIGHINVLQRFSEESSAHRSALTQRGWKLIDLSTAWYLLVMCFLNLFVAFSGYFTLSQWVNYKLFGTLVISFVYMGILMFLIRHEVVPSETTGDSTATTEQTAVTETRAEEPATEDVKDTPEV